MWQFKYVIAESSVRELELRMIVVWLTDCSLFIQEFRAYAESERLPTL